MEMEQRRVPSSKGGWTYDVFLSFRGEDTRFGFTGHLYHALCQRGINTFMDDEALKRGEQISAAISKAIEGSRMAIIVFSKNYASSKWCLEELVKILDCLKARERVVYPVFYNVDPSEIRHQRGSCGEQLAKHEEEMKDNKEKVQNWRLALHEAANLAGWPVRDRYEYEIIKKIVDMVSSTLEHPLLHVDDRAVGLEFRVSQMMYRLQIAARTIIMVGIYGVGGIGKTTLARAVYNLIGQEFEGSCFLSDVSGNSTKYGLAYFQEVILSDIVGESIKLGNEYNRIPIVIKRLQGKRVLLILDDVDKLEQLKNLAGDCNWFGLGSRIIITTRHKDILTAHGVENIYEVPRLEYFEALQLLSSKASPKPGDDYKVLWDRAIDYSNGLPLVLKVIGSDLLEKSVDEWDIALDRYEKVHNKEIQRMLKVSYDSLDECEKSIFLDIACFFIGEPVSCVEEILSACGLYPRYGIRRLVDRSLLSISSTGRLMMHDHIIDMAMKIVQQESPLHPGQRSRLWLRDDVLQVLDENMGTDKIEVMMFEDLPLGNDVGKLSDKAFKEMTKLRILIFKDVIYSGVPQHLPNSIRVLKWGGYPTSCLPPDFLNFPPNCLILNRFKSMKCLAKIDFTDCKFLSEVPDISGVSKLRILHIDNCINLIKIHDSVGFLGDLEELTAVGCINLKIIPAAFKLAHLRVLSFSECSRLIRFPEILCMVENLQYLNLWQTAIEELPFSIGNFRGLESLNLMECSRLEKLPSSIFTLPRLQEIQADSCRRFAISTETEDHRQLELTVSPNKIYLYLSYCNLTDEHLVSCLSGFANMVHLDISDNNFTTLPACIKECMHLKTLLLTNCKQLQHISFIPPNLEDIDALNCTSLTPQSSSVLLNQTFHEMEHKTVMLPGSRPPEWFDHFSSERSITFWGHKRFPEICVGVAFGMLENPPHHFHVRFCLVINNNMRILSQHSYSWSIVAEHVWIFDLNAVIHNGNLSRMFIDHDWNHVEVSCVDCEGENSMAQVVNGPTRRAIVKWYGIYLYKQGNKMEDILFTNDITLEENGTSFGADHDMIVQSADDGTFHENYCHIESDDGLEISSHHLSKRQHR